MRKSLMLLPRPCQVVRFLVPLALAFVCLLPRPALATGRFVVSDSAELLSATELATLQDDYARLTDYLDVAFVTCATNPASTESFAQTFVEQTFGQDAAVAFVIDMDNRMLYVYANHAGLQTISEADARAITDNIYTLASNGDYYACTQAAFEQILAKCEGGRIARPVKHITNALIALVLGTLANFFLAMRSRAGTTRRKRKKAALARTEALPKFLIFTKVTRTVTHHIHSGSGGSGFGGGGGRSGGGGGFGGGGRGGGGGHRF